MLNIASERHMSRAFRWGVVLLVFVINWGIPRSERDRRAKDAWAEGGLSDH